MKVIKVNGEAVESLKAFNSARAKKNEGTREEKNQRKVLELTLPDLTQKQTEVSFMFNGKPVATWTQGERNGIDSAKLQAEFPQAYAACYLPSKVWTLDVLL